MPEYINVDVMKKMLIESADGSKKKLKIAKAFSNMLDVTPKADAAPIIHACWLKEDEDLNTYFCSHCNALYEFAEGNPGSNDVLYCPHCGAHMDMEVQNDEK